MGYLAAYNTSSFPGSLDGGPINIAISSSIFSGSTGAIRFGDIPFPPSGGMTIISDSNTQLGVASASATPLFWAVNSLTDTASVLNTINALPERVTKTRFVTTSSAYLYLVSSSKYFPILGTQPLNTPVTDGLVMYLNAGQLISYPTTASTWYDVSGNNKNGTLTNGPLFNSNQGSINFDGTDDYVAIPNELALALNGNPGATLEMILLLKKKDNTSGQSGLTQLSGFNNTNGNLYFFANFGDGTGGLFLDVFRNSRVTIPTSSLSSKTVDPLLWHQLNITTTPGTDGWKVYWNGELKYSTTGLSQVYVSSSTYTPTFSASIGDLTFGKSSGTRELSGSIASYKLYNRTLTQQEVLQNYYQAPIVTNGLVFAVDANNLVSYESSSVRAYSLSLSGSRTTPVSCSLTNGLAFYNINGGYFDFDGTDDQLLIENVPAQSTGIHLGNGTIPWMVNAWVKTSVAGDNNIGSFPILSNRSGGPVYSNMGIGSGGVMKYAHYSGSWIVETGNTAVNNNRWHMLSWVNLNNNTLNMYVDGIFDKNVSSSIVGGGNINPVDIIGASFGGFLNGDIAFLSINISSSLYTIQNVLQNFNAQRSRFGI